MASIRTIPVNGHAIRAARMRRGLSQRQLAQRAGVTQSRISAAENGADIGELTLHRIANALGADADQLTAAVGSAA